MILRISSIFVLILTVIHLNSSAAAAHPLGNFTVNHYAGLHVTEKSITLDFVLDMAEIPAFQEITTFDQNGNGVPNATEARLYQTEKCQSLTDQLVLSLNRQPLALSLQQAAVTFPAGAGGLLTLRLNCQFQAPLPAPNGELMINFENKVMPNRLGWREIVISSDGVSLDDDALAGMRQSISNRLTAYPDNLLSQPLDQRNANFQVTPTGIALAPLAKPNLALAQPTPPQVNREDGFTELISLENLTLPTILVALAIAFTWGAAHALTPGHGKTIVAAYLVGSRGTISHAVFLGLVTTFTHTAGVFVLGFLTLFASQYILPEQLYPWLGVMSGAIVVGIGFSLFRGRLASFIGSDGVAHHHSHDHNHRHHHDHSHDHDHHHDHGSHTHSHGSHTHTHLPPGADGSPVTWRNLLALGVSGGLIPCPSALVVMLSAIALQRIGFGLVLIVTFSLGLAGVLTAIGVLWVQARRLFDHMPKQQGLSKYLPVAGRISQALPALSALFITIIGIGVMLQALLQTGLL